MRRSIIIAATLALALGTWLTPAALACTVEGGPFPLSTQVVDRASLAVQGTVISAVGGEDAPVVIEVSVERVLKGATTDETVRVSNWGNCPFIPAAGKRVVVAANAEGELVGAWRIDGQAAQEWIPTDPKLTTTAAIRAAFGLPDTAVASPASAATRTTGATPLLVAVWAASAIASLALLSRRRRPT